MAIERFKYFLLPFLIASFVAAPVLFLFPQVTDAQAATAGCATTYLTGLLGFGATAGAATVVATGGAGAGAAAGVGSAVQLGTSVPVGNQVESTQLSGISTAIGGLAAAQGIVNTQTAITNTQQGFYTCILRPIVEAMAARMLANITNSLVTWIQSGFNGNPAFVTNIGDFLNTSADQAIGNFIQNDPSLSLLCSPFSTQIRIALAVNFSTQQYQGCTLTQVTKNITDFGNTFDAWNQWLAVTTAPANNMWGASIQEQGLLQDTINDKLKSVNDEVSRGSGFLDQQVCDGWSPPVNINTGGLSYNVPAVSVAPTCTHWKTVTPGTTISSALGSTYSTEFNDIGGATDIDQVIGALINELISTTITGPGGLLGSGTPSAPISGTADLASLAEQQSSSFYTGTTSISISNAAVISDLNGQVAQAQTNAASSTQALLSAYQSTASTASTTSAAFRAPSLPSTASSPINLSLYSSYPSGSFAYAVGTTLSGPANSLEAVITIKNLGGTYSPVTPSAAFGSNYALYLINQEGQKILADGNSLGSQLLQSGTLTIPIQNTSDTAGFEFDTDPASLTTSFGRGGTVSDVNTYEFVMTIESASGAVLATNTAYFQVQ